jgi:hypothetical protein
MPSAAADRFKAWVAADAPAAPVARFRVAFAAIWLVYDLLDLWTCGTARIDDWLGTGSPPGLVALQAALIACELAVVVGAPARLVPGAMLVAAVLRAIEWNTYLRLNDFAYFAVTALILAHARAPSREPSRDAVGPRWPRDVLVWQAAWIYFATGLMKLNPTWLSGRHLYVRLEYLRTAFGWHYPEMAIRCADSLPCDAALAWCGVGAELLLAALLVLRPGRRLVAPLVVGIHTFGALATNVWFFGPSLIAQVTLLADKGWGERPARRPGTESTRHA